MTDAHLDLSREYDERAGQALLGLYNLAASGGGYSGIPLSEVYRDALGPVEAEFQAGIESGDQDRVIAAWNKLTEIAAHIAHAHTRLGTVLLATVVNNMNFTPEEAVRGAIEESRKNSS